MGHQFSIRLRQETCDGSSSQGTFDSATRALILRALQAAGWVIGAPNGAAAQLGVKRTTLIANVNLK
jgi:transcriptional regulator of acetoin/glycerol metabolism